MSNLLQRYPEWLRGALRLADPELPGQLITDGILPVVDVAEERVPHQQYLTLSRSANVIGAAGVTGYAAIANLGTGVVVVDRIGFTATAAMRYALTLHTFDPLVGLAGTAADFFGWDSQDSRIGVQLYSDTLTNAPAGNRVWNGSVLANDERTLPGPYVVRANRVLAVAPLSLAADFAVCFHGRFYP